MTIAYRNRIVDYRQVRAGDLNANPRNWREHPPEQEAAIRAALNEIGFAGAVIAREKDGALELLDGHLRAGLDPETMIPVLITDLDDDEADKFLLSFDPISNMASASSTMLAELLDRVRYDEAELDELKARLRTEYITMEVDDLATGHVTGVASPDAPRAGVKLFQLVYDMTTYEEVVAAEHILRKRYGTASMSATVLAAFRELARE